MRSRLLLSSAVVVLAVAAMGCKLKVDAKPTGFKEGSDDVVVVHVVTSGGADLTCSEDACPLTKVPQTGEMDLDVRIPPNETKRVFLNVKLGPRKGQTVLDLKTSLPPKLAVAGSYGTISCEPRTCNGILKLIPKSRLSMSSEPGTVFEIGADKLTVPPDGYIEAPITLAATPPLDKLPLAKVCVGIVSGATTSPPWTTVTVTATFADKSTATTKGTLDMAFVERTLSETLKDVTKGPIAFPWEKAGTPARGKRAAVYVDGSYCYDAGQADAVVGDLDVIALSESQKRVGECTYTSATGTLKGKIEMRDENATAYDRVTGKKLGTKLFVAPKDCSGTFYAKPGESAPDKISLASNEAIAQWAATFAK